MGDYLNGIEGKVISDMDATTGRYGVSIVYQDKAKKLALQPKNISIVRTTSDDGDSSSTTEPSKKQQRLNDNSNKARATSSTAGGNGDAKPAVSKDTITKAMGILDDPEKTLLRIRLIL